MDLVDDTTSSVFHVYFHAYFKLGLVKKNQECPAGVEIGLCKG